MVGSSISRAADYVLYTLVGPEISVAITKAYSCQIIASYLLVIQFGLVKVELDKVQYDKYIEEVKSLPDKIQKIINDKERLQWFASKIANSKDIFLLDVK